MNFICKFADNKPLLIGILATIVGIVLIAMVLNAIQQRRENKRGAREIKPEDYLTDDAGEEAGEPESQADASDAAEAVVGEALVGAQNVDHRRTANRTGTPYSPNPASGDVAGTDGSLDRADRGEVSRGQNGKPLDKDDWSEL